MPFYTFQCRTCETIKEELRDMGDNDEPLCDVCQYNPEIQGEWERMERIITAPGLLKFKGKGFHQNDYPSKPPTRFGTTEQVGGVTKSVIETTKHRPPLNEIMDSKPVLKYGNDPKDKHRKKKKKKP